MCQASDPEVQRLVEDLVSQKISKGEIFTAYKDITLDIRKDGTHVRHSEVRTAVHGMFSDGEMGNYEQGTIRPAGAPVPVLIYYPAGGDPSQYDSSLGPRPGSIASKLGIGNPIGQGAPTPQTPLSTPSDPATDDDDSGIVRRTGQEGYLYIPTSMVRDIGLTNKQKAYVYANGKGLAVTGKLDDSSAPQFSGDLLAQYAVDTKGNVRIPDHHLPSKTGSYKICPSKYHRETFIAIS